MVVSVNSAPSPDGLRRTSKNWIVKPSVPEEFFVLLTNSKQPITPNRLIGQLLWNRGLKTAEEIEKFLNPDYEKHVHDPFLFKGMEKAAGRLIRAVDAGEKIIVFADYDADGIDGAAILAGFLKKGEADFDVFIPDRFVESYGLSMKRIDEFKALGAKLIITVDCGVTDYDEIEKANEYGMDVVVMDHHIVPPRWPNAHAIVDHKQEDETYPEKVLCGTGLAFKLIQGVLLKKRYGTVPGWEKWLLDAVAIGTVADMVPLTGENRVLVKYGIDVMKKMRRPGLRAMLRAKNILPENITAETIGFTIAPRINAASRMDHANIAFELLMTENQYEADWLSKRLEEKNAERKTLVEAIVGELERKLAGIESPKLILEGSSEWPAGVLGIAANRLLEKFGCPVFLYSEMPAVVKGSCRAPDGMNVVELMRSTKDVFSDFGGHAHSGGFSIPPEKLITMRPQLEEIIESGSFERRETPVEADAEMELSQVNADTYAAISELEPFGQGNPKPVFLLKNVLIRELRRVGQDQTHVKMKLGEQGIGAIFFRASHNGFKEGERIDVLANLQENRWNGNTNIELNIIDAVKT